MLADFNIKDGVRTQLLNNNYYLLYKSARLQHNIIIIYYTNQLDYNTI